MCSKCQNSTQGAYNQESNLKATPYTNNLGSQSYSGSVNEKGLNNAQNEKFEGTKAVTGGNAHIGQSGFGS